MRGSIPARHDDREHELGAVLRDRRLAGGVVSAILVALGAGAMLGAAWLAPTAVATGAGLGTAIVALALSLQILDSVACRLVGSWTCRECRAADDRALDESEPTGIPVDDRAAREGAD